MATSDLIAALALVVSGLSLALSWWGTFRDRVRLRVSAALTGGGEPEYGPERIRIRVVNVGRRVAVLTMFGGDLSDAGWHGTHLGQAGGGLHLAESQFYEREFFAEDIESISPEGRSSFSQLWFEDSHGRRHMVPKSRDLLERLRSSGPTLTAGKSV